MELSKRALKQARDAAVAMGCKAVNLYTRLADNEKSWEALEAKLGITIPPMFKGMPLSYANVSSFKTYWIDGFEGRLKHELQVIDQPEIKVETIDKVATKKRIDANDRTGCYKMGELQLFPEQQAAFDVIWDKMIVRKVTRALMNDGDTGSGKTFLNIAIIHRLLAENHIDFGRHPYAAIIILAPVPVLESWARLLEQAGLGEHIGTKILLTSYSQMTATLGGVFIQEHYDPYSQSDKPKLVWNPILVPYIILCDEMHNLKNKESRRTQTIRAALRLLNPPLFFGTSATPAVTVNDSETFVIATGARFMGIKVTEDNFNQFAGMICRDPSKPNVAASKRLREVLKDYIVSFPYVKWPSKAINGVKIVDFANDADRRTYDTSYQRYLDNCKKAGKNTNFGQFEQLVALNQHVYTAEPLHMDQVVDLALASYDEGKAPVIAVQSRRAVQKAVFKLIDKHGFTRDDISIIWGGKKALDPTKMLSEGEIAEMMGRVASGEVLDPSEHRRLLETIAIRTDKIMSGDADEEAQNDRLAKLVGYKLTGVQNARLRQAEIDKFQSGQAKFCIFTLAAGGTGLSLDQCRPELRPRETYLTPVYSGPLFKQGLGRCIRRATVSDVYQWVCLLANTVEETHVAPVLDEKLKCITEVTNNRTNWLDIVGGMATASYKRSLRTKEEMARDAEEEASQFHDVSDVTEDDDE